jgi:AraC-like DNA-binding protein/ligand-binding sensor protein
MLSMSGKQLEPVAGLDARHPLIRQVAEMTAEATGMRLLLVYPEASGWGQAHGDTQTQLQPAFCKLVRSTPEGAKHCRMCHILMAAAACNGGPTEQRCHAGASVLVCPASNDADESIAVLSSCIFSSVTASDEVRQRGEKLGIDMASLHQAFMDLPKLSEQQLQVLRCAMQTMTQAVRVVRQNMELSSQIQALQSGGVSPVNLERFLEEPAWAKASRRHPAGRRGSKPLLVHVVCELVRQRPDLPLTVKELAAAARLTPNHFTTLFREHAGSPFTEYLTEQRIARAKKLLRNPTLSINEVARMVGYDDPGYFTRRFHQKTKLSPREWRNRRGGREAPD